jgi:hypothetical protein
MQRRQECHVTNTTRTHVPAKLPKEHMKAYGYPEETKLQVTFLIFATFVKTSLKLIIVLENVLQSSCE